MHFSRLSSLISLCILSSPVVQALQSCVAFDANWNLLAFGFGDKDYNAGVQTTWTSASAAPTDITASGRPPFNGANATCYLSQFTNSIYVLGADSSDPAAIYIYDATAKAWSKQAVTPGNLNPASFTTILDHDTNVFYALSGGEMFSLDMALLKSATSSPIPWNDVQRPSFATNDYQPVMALAQNHIHFMDVPGLSPGNAQIFVIHFSYTQPEPQSYGEPAFPSSHGQATSFFMDEGVQQEFAFIPDDGSATYVINVETNTTRSLSGPSFKDAAATYFASTNALVQLTSKGQVSFLPYNPSSADADAQSSWSTITNLPVGLATTPNSPSSNSGSSNSNSSSPGSSSASPSIGASGTPGKNNTSTGTHDNAAGCLSFAWGAVGALLTSLFLTVII